MGICETADVQQRLCSSIVENLEAEGSRIVNQKETFSLDASVDIGAKHSPSTGMKKFKIRFRCRAGIHSRILLYGIQRNPYTLQISYRYYVSGWA